MVTMAGKQTKLVDALNSLIELAFDAIEAYQAAISRTSRPDDKQELTAFMGDHERHTRELAPHVARLGGTAKHKGDFKAVLTKGKVQIAGLVGDRAILMAMKTNEDDTNAAYEFATQRTDIDNEELRSLLHANLSDERKHRAWLERRITEGERPRV